MQFNLTLRCLDPNPVLPLNYQYEFSSWIYRVLGNADAEYAQFLHEKGHQTPRNKSFKLFCFSQLYVPQMAIEGDRLLIKSPLVQFRLSFYIDRTAEEFIKGLFRQQEFRVGDRRSQVRFVVESVQVEVPERPATGQVLKVSTLSPMVVGRHEGPDKHDTYLHPNDPDFAPLLYFNLMEKYEAASGNAIPVWWDARRFGFRVLSENIRSQLIAIKVRTPQESKIKGYRFDFELDCPPELQEMGLYAGFGRYNAQGFGFGQVLRERREIPTFNRQKERV